MINLRQFKFWVFTLEGLNALASAYFFNYVFFFLQKHHGFGPYDNLRFGALNGFLFVFSSLYGGKYAQRNGYFSALRLGFILMIVALAFGCFASTVLGLCITLSLWTFGMCFTWPALEGMACEKENHASLPKMLAIYNIVWAGGGAIAYFSGGWAQLHLGSKSIFWVPVILHGIQLVIVSGLRHRLPRGVDSLAALSNDDADHIQEASPKVTEGFKTLAWVANPFAYIAQSAIVPLIPELAQRLDLSAASAGVFCSIWLFARLFSFVILGLWTGWHYRFGWLISCYLLLGVAFCGILLFTNLWWLALLQIVFGLCVGLVYYSSLYYSMNASQTLSEHGGMHEAALGVGLFAGPAIGASALWLVPGQPHGAVYAVAVTLFCGGVVLMKLKPKTSRTN